MSKFLRLEFTRTAKLFFGLILAIIIVNVLLYPTIANFSDFNSLFGGMAMTFLVILMLVLNLLFLFMIVSYFRRDLYQNSGYLTFSLPVSSKAYLGAKLLNSAFWIILLWIATLVFNYLALRYFVGLDELDTMISYIRDNVISSPLAMIALLLYMIISFFHSLVLMFFSIILNRAMFKSKRLGFFWVLFYILFSYGIEMASTAITQTLPYFIMSDGTGIKWVSMTAETIVSGGILSYADSLTFFSGISIPSILLYAIITVILFSISAKLLQSKVDI